MWIEDWTPSAACRQAQPDELFVRGAEQNKAKQLCTGCPVRTECLAEALDNQIEWGVWGGMTERERRALLRRRPNASWRGRARGGPRQGESRSPQDQSPPEPPRFIPTTESSPTAPDSRQDTLAAG